MGGGNGMRLCNGLRGTDRLSEIPSWIITLESKIIINDFSSLIS